MRDFHGAVLVLVMGLVTFLLRAMPFAVFNGRRKMPKVVLYLGEVLPSAVLGMLVIYCWKDLRLTTAPWSLPELLASAVVVLVQVWKHSSLWSILAGTGAYLLLLQIF